MFEAFSLTGRVSVVTGATSHLGKTMARCLAELGSKVYLVGRNDELLEQLCHELKSNGLLAVSAPFDVTDASETSDFLRMLTTDEGRLDVLVNSANGTGLAESSADRFHAAYEVAVVAVHRLVTCSLPLLQSAVEKVGSASIINIASMYGVVSPDFRVYEDSPPSFAHYGAAKAGMIQLTRYLACELGAKAIRVNAISPGPFPSPHSQEHFPKLMQNLKAKVPLGRLGEPAEISGAIAYLASDASRFVTGINLPVDGGWTAW
jgi:NAD(P)-dependent dehydrogenase (short-subunit alcohol dehydrogenase family)